MLFHQPGYLHRIGGNNNILPKPSRKGTVIRGPSKGSNNRSIPNIRFGSYIPEWRNVHRILIHIRVSKHIDKYFRNRIKHSPIHLWSCINSWKLAWSKTIEQQLKKDSFNFPNCIFNIDDWNVHVQWSENTCNHLNVCMGNSCRHR